MTASPLPALSAQPYLYRLLLAITGMTLLRVVYLAIFPHPLYGDEAQYWTWAQTLDWGYYSKPPLIAWAIALTTLAGDAEFWVRLSSPLAHSVAALGIYATASVLYNARIGFWSALVYATLPAVFFSSVVISTDPLLLACWAWGLFFISAGVLYSCRWSWLAAGVAIGLAILAKYAGIMLLLGVVGFVISYKPTRVWLRRWPFYAMMAVVLVVISPNLLWNVAQDFVTINHTRDNANLSGTLLNIDKGLEFLSAQFGVFGPVLFVLLGIGLYRLQRPLNLADSLLLWCILPLLAMMMAQGFLSRANANWAAAAYVAASIFVTARFLDKGYWLRGSIVLHSVIMMAGLSLAFWQLPYGKAFDPFQRLKGYDAIIAQFDKVHAAHPALPVITDHRRFTALMLYYSEARTLYKWPFRQGHVGDYYDQTMAFPNVPPANDFLLITTVPEPSHVTDAFIEAHLVDILVTTTHPNRTLTYYIWRVYGYRGR